MKLARLDEIEELLAGHVGARLVRHHGGKGLSGLKAQESVALRMRRSAGSRMRARRKKIMGSKVLNPCPTHSFKGANATPRLQHRARRVSETLVHARAPAKQAPTHTTPRSPQNTDLQCLRAVMMEWSRLYCRPKCPRPLLRSHLPRRPRLPQRSVPKLQQLQSRIKVRERVSKSLTSSGATSGECARAHPLRTRRTPSTPGSSN
jgi:hypothetical protein